jgi:uncharacterized protein (TIGR02646 family)
MRNVTRNAKPRCLIRNSSRWRDEYLVAISAGDAVLTKRRRGRYNHKEVRCALDKMYRNLCCYCESQVGPVKADQIEHRMPIQGFPRMAFDWKNLHLACGGCNGAKKDQWDPNNPILDAVADVPIDDHLGYRCSETGVRRTWLTPRGRTTASHADLNREKLRGARSETMIKVVGVIQQIRERLAVDPTDALALNRRAELEEMYTGQYGSMIRWAVTTLLV